VPPHGKPHSVDRFVADVLKAVGCIRVEGDGIAWPEFVAFEAEADPQASAPHKPVLAALVAHERAVGR
jgi:hypothetical protein